MSACAICLDTLKAPVALPCGHVYCHGCISEAVKVTPCTSSPATYCPTCREPVPLVAPNPLSIPPHLRPYILPPFRRLYLNVPAPAPSSASTDADSASSPTEEEVEKITARLHMENAVLRQSCHAWRARANAHVAAHLGLSALVRLARDQARILKGERDELARKYDALKRKFSDVHRESEPEPETDEDGVLIWTELAPQAQDEAKVEPPALTVDVPCVPYMCPAADVSPVSNFEPQGNSKRRKISPSSLYSEVPAKSAASIPAMVIPYLASQRSTASTRSTLYDSA